MRSTRHSGTGWRERGAAAVEFALVLPLLLLFVAGIVDFGRYFLTEIQLTNAAREGARASIIDSANAEVRARAAVSPDLDARMTVTTVPCSGPGDATVTVVDPTFDWILLYGVPVPSAESTAVMRCVS